MLCDEQIKKDLLKINFENYTFVPNEFNDNGGDLIGFHTLENNLTFLGGVAGGDCQTPIFYILYYNKKLRGYIPILGNLFNRITKFPLGYSLRSDTIFLRKETNIKDVSSISLEYNWDLIKKDLLTHFNVI